MTTATEQTTVWAPRQFRAPCRRCPDGAPPIFTSDGGGTWKHVKAPAEKHVAFPTGVMVETSLFNIPGFVPAW